ncbi:HAD-IC family P-type ATPase [Saccharomonospora sp. NPDC046836]|uniref:HAD-IC family P-type ATPase n=1 Tax=Saccharomonospora sp. NPDC046836 TaxID=3156921 RepID=UPI0033C5C4F8
MNLFGLGVPGPLAVVGATLGTARGLAEITLRPRRIDRTLKSRLHIEAHGVHAQGSELVAKRIERALEEHPAVAWARVNAPSSRVIIELADPTVGAGELLEIVQCAEAEPPTPEEAAAEDELHHPADGTRGTRLLPTLTTDLFGLALSALTRIAPWTPLPPEVAAALTLVDHHPVLKEGLARRTGSHDRADSLTSQLTALAQGLAGGTEGTLLDTALRFGQWREAREHERAWAAAEDELITGPDGAEAAPCAITRPVPLPEGDVEQYERRVLALGASATAVTAPFVGARRAFAVGLTALPKSAEAGRTAFATGLGTVLARRGTLVMDRAVLRRLDRIDTLVLDRSALETGRSVLRDLEPLPGGDRHAIAELAWRLFDPSWPGAVRSEREWRLGPLDALDVDVETGRQAGDRMRRRGATGLLGLARGPRLQAVLALAGEPLPGMHTLLAAAQRSQLKVVYADEPFDRVRELQEQGAGVLLVSDDRQALGAADCGIGVHRTGDAAPWGAHVLVGDDVGAAALLVEAVVTAKRVNAESIRIAQASTGVGVVTALQSEGASATVRGQRVVNVGAGIALVNGRRHARGIEPPDVVPPETVPWHLMPAQAVLDRLGSSAEGLSALEARRRARARGVGPLGTTLGSAFLAELANPLTPVLAGGAALSAAVGSLVDAGLVVGVIGLSALIGSLQQVHTERELAELLSKSSVSATVLRDGDERVVTADDLVPGDVVSLAAGDVVPADCRLLETTGFEADESSLTGESLPVAKDPAAVVAGNVAERTSMVYEGTTVAAGEATAVVVAVGDDTEAGKSMAIARAGAPPTGVERRLSKLTEQSLPLAAGSAVAVAGAGLLRGVPLRESLGAAVNLAVASVPEGLPFLVSAAQLAAARRLAEHGALVRNPRSIEALGRVDVLCFDKTGTLTEGRLSVSDVDDGSRRARLDALDGALRPVLAAALRATPQEAPEDLPHATDRAIVEAGQQATLTAATGASGWRPVSAAPFEPSRGYHAAVGSTRKGLLLSVKGAPEEVLPRCSLDERTRKRLFSRMRALAKAGKRVLAVAERFVDSAEISPECVRELTFRGFVGIADPVRRSAAPAAARLQNAGVRIVMITGDHPVTGAAIAAEINNRGDLHVVTGAELEELDDERLRKVLAEVDVVARCTPAQKVRIIKAYQQLGKTVAMTGDGANDAPAIRLADVGIALGRRGTPAARAAADLVVTDDRLETIIAALVEGRAMWASVRSALSVLLGGNVGEITFSLIGAAMTGRSPLTARQLLLMNLLTDLAPSMAIALRRPNGEAVEELLQEGPESSLGTRLYREIGVRAGSTTLGATTAWSIARFTGRRRRAGTVALAAIVGTQLAQTLLTAGRSPSVLVSAAGSAAVLAAVVQTPGVSQFFGCTPLGPFAWSIALGSAGAASVLGALFG